GPRSAKILGLQASHRSEDIWKGLIRSRCIVVTIGHGHYMITLIPFIQQAGFYGIAQIGHISLDHALITALVKRWRQETHDFHMVVDEMTVTLQDVAVLQGLRIDGSAVKRPFTCDRPWDALCEELLLENRRAISGTSLRLSWLYKNFAQLPLLFCDPNVLERHTRAYILCLLGSILFPDSSGDTVPLMFLHMLIDLYDVDTYSWGSRTLAWLYRSLCRDCHRCVPQINGNLLLLQ
ncbi:LOW QUALITY PROTEIN: PMD domain-containing protein, partial [Cephalotus follicularis]